MKKIIAVLAVSGFSLVGCSTTAEVAATPAPERVASVVAAEVAPAAPAPVVAEAEAEVVLTEAVAVPVVAAPVVAEAVGFAEPVTETVVDPTAPVAFEAPVAVASTEEEPVVFGPETEYVTASDGSLVPASELAAYEAYLANGGEVAIGFTEPVEVEPQPGDPIVYGPDTVYVTASDGSLVPESELAAYEAWLAENQAPVTFGPETVYVTASDGSLVPESELESYEAWLAAGNQAPTTCG